VFHLRDHQGKAVYLEKTVGDFQESARLFLHIFYRYCCIKTMCGCSSRYKSPLHWQNKSFFLCEERNASRRGFGYVCVLYAQCASVQQPLSPSLSFSLAMCLYVNSLMSWQNSSPSDIKGSVWSNAPLESSDII